MEVSFVKELDLKGKEPVFGSNSCQSLVELRSIEQVAADDDDEADKCKHFTIRGYVAKVRRRDAKICWPLFLPHNQTSCDLLSSLPPLPVTKFKRWNCQKCLSEISTSEGVITDGAFIKVQNDEVNICNTTILINAGAANLLSGFQQPPEDNIVDGRLVEGDSPGNASNGECGPSLSCGKKENASIDRGLTEEGLQIHKGGPGRSEENQDQSSKPTFAGEPTISPNECTMPLGVDINFPKADVLSTISAHMPGHHSMHLNKRHTEASDNSMGLPNDINQNRDHSRELGNSYGRFHHKKVQKVRLLDDIIRSGELNISKKVHLSSGDAKANQTKNGNDRSPDTSYWKLQHLDNKSHLATQNIQEMPIIEASQSEDEENSLMDWLKKMSKKSIAQKGHSENKHLDTTVGIYSGSSSQQGTNRYKRKSSLEKENKMPPLKPEWPFLVPQQDSYIAEDVSTKLLSAKTVNNRSTGCRVSGKSLHHGPEIQEGNNNKAILSNKKNKAPPVEDSSKVKKKAVKKIKTRNMSEQECLDGIPMDIVELLAKHQHERCLINAGVASESMHNLSEMTGKGNDSDESKVLDAVPEDLGQQRSHFNQAVDAVHTTMRKNRDADCRIEACDSTKSCKQNLHIDLNQQPVEFLELSQCSGEPLGRLEHPAAVSSRSYSPQGFGWDKMKLQTSGSCHRNQAIAIKISSRNDHDGASVPLHGRAFGSIARKDGTHFNFMNVDSQDSCLDQSLKTVGQKTDCHDSHDPKFTSLQILGKEQVEPSIDIHPEATYSFVEAGNGCHSRTIEPLDLYVSETISALHLLMLMDPSARSAASDTSPLRSILEAGLNYTDGLEVGFRTKEMPEHPGGAGFSDQDQHQGNFSKPCHPVPRISYRGAFLRKEIATQSNSHQTLQGFEDRHPVELSPDNIIEKEKSDTSCSAIHTEVGNTKTSLYMGIHSKQIVSGLDSAAHSSCSLPVNEMDQARTSRKDRAVQPLTSHCELLNCVVNRNPADFTTPDEDKYMIGINNPRNRYISFSKSLQHRSHPGGQKQQ